MAQTPSNNWRIPLWLDCDPGHDDAFAILFAAYHPCIELLGISTTHGNSSVERTTINAGRILTAIGRPDVPVHVGSAAGLARPAVHAPAIHGESGLDGTSLLPEPAVPPNLQLDAVNGMAKALLATPRRKSWLVATGALTNIARAVKAYPDLVQHIKGLSIMGGAVGGGFTSAPLGKVGDKLRFGNWTPFAEFNIVVDPEAASYLFKNLELAAKTTLIPLDVTHQVLATQDILDMLLYGKMFDKPQAPSTMRTMLVELLNFFKETYATVFGIAEGPPLHDPLAVAAVLDGVQEYEMPFYDFKLESETFHERAGEFKEINETEAIDSSITRTPSYESLDAREGKETFPSGTVRPKERYEVKVITDGTYEEALNGNSETGRTVVKLLPMGEAGVKIPRGLDVQRFWLALEECLQKADTKNALIQATDR